MSVEDIIRSSIADLPGRDSDDGDSSGDDGGVADDAVDAGGEESAVEDAPAVVAEGAEGAEKPVVEGEPAIEPAKELSETEKLLEEEGFKKLRGDGKENRIPHSRTVKIMENRERKLAEEITGALVPAGVKPSEAIKQFVAQVPEFQTKIKAYETELETSNNVLTIMENDAERFIGMLLQVNPEYKKYLRGGGEEEQVATPVVDPTEPHPDLDLGDGRMTYSVDGWAKREAWVSAQLEKRIEARLEKRFKPLTEDYEREQRIQEAIPRFNKMREGARANWPGYGDHEPEILEAVKANKSYSLHDGYIHVINAKHKAALEAAELKVKEAEANVLKKIKAAPTSTSSAVGGTKPQAPISSGDSVEDIIRKSIEPLKRGKVA